MGVYSNICVVAEVKFVQESGVARLWEFEMRPVA